MFKNHKRTGYTKTNYKLIDDPIYIGEEPKPYAVPTQIKFETANVWHVFPEDKQLTLFC
jgi:hypothetical protein